jgi:DNA-binding YbaB/EbfC family protein
MFNKESLSDLLQQAQKMQESMQETQNKLSNLQVEGESGAGMVKITIKGDKTVVKVSIDPSVMDDKDMLEDLIAAAFNDTIKKLDKYSSEEMGKLTSGLPSDLLKGFKLPF